MLVYQEPVRFKYYAPFYGVPGAFRFVVLASAIAVSLITSYTSGSLWVKTRERREQPTVAFTSNLVAIFEGQYAGAGDGTVVTSTFAYATMPDTARALERAGILASSSLAVSEDDLNHDGKADVVRLKLDASFPRGRSGAPFEVRGFKLLAEFDYAMRRAVHMDMKGAPLVAASSGVAAAGLYADGTLALRQVAPLDDYGTRTTYDAPMLGSGSESAAFDAPASGAVGLLQASGNVGPSLARLVASSLDRNETLHFAPDAVLWHPGHASDGFAAEVVFRVPPHQSVLVRPRTIEILKFGWVQFLASFVVFYFVGAWIEWAAFHYRILPTTVVSDARSKVKLF